MLKYLYYTIILINVLFFLRGRQNRIVSCLSFFFVIIFAMGKRFDGSHIAYDLRNYEAIYNNLNLSPSVEKGYAFLVKIGNAIGLSFEQFYMVYVGICLVTIFFVFTKRMRSNPHIIIVAYLIYFILLPIDQLRNLGAVTIMTFCFPMYRDALIVNHNTPNRDGKRIIRTLLIIILASFFHKSMIVYIFLVLLFILNKRKKIVYLTGVIIVFSLGALITRSNSIIGKTLKFILDLLGGYGSKYSELYSLTSTFGSAFLMIIIMLFLILSVRNWKIQNEKNSNKVVSEVEASFVLNITELSSIFLLLVLINSTSYRIIRDLVLICIFYLGVNADSNHMSLKNRSRILLYVCLLSVGLFIFDIVVKGYGEDYTKFFFDNEILKI